MGIQDRIEKKEKRLKKQAKLKSEHKQYIKMFRYDENGQKRTTSEINKLILNQLSKEKEENKKMFSSEDMIIDSNERKDKHKIRKIENIIQMDLGSGTKNVKQTIECDFDY